MFLQIQQIYEEIPQTGIPSNLKDNNTVTRKMKVAVIAILAVSIVALDLFLWLRNGSMSEKKLIEHVRLAINPQYQDWVLYSHGTYIIVENLEEDETHECYANKLMDEFGPVAVGGPAGDFSVTNLDKTDGWSISGYGYGMYTYAHPKEMDIKNPQSKDVGLFGRSKRHSGSQEQKIIHVSKKNVL